MKKVLQKLWQQKQSENMYQKMIKKKCWKPCTMALDENGENVRHLAMAEVVLIHCNIVDSNY